MKLYKRNKAYLPVNRISVKPKSKIKSKKKISAFIRPLLFCFIAARKCVVLIKTAHTVKIINITCVFDIGIYY